MLNIPAGWKLVPERATKAMQDAWDSAPFNEDTDIEFHGAYRAMIEAAPSPLSAAPASAQEEAKDERQAFEAWHKREFGSYVPGLTIHYNRWLGWEGRASVAAPAAGDAQALEDLQRLIEYAQTSDDCQYGTLSTGLVRDLTAKAIAALAAPRGQGGE